MIFTLTSHRSLLQFQPNFGCVPVLAEPNSSGRGSQSRNWQHAGNRETTEQGIAQESTSGLRLRSRKHSGNTADSCGAPNLSPVTGLILWTIAATTIGLILVWGVWSRL